MKYNWVYQDKCSYRIIIVLVATLTFSYTTHAQHLEKSLPAQFPGSKLAPVLHPETYRSSFHTFRVSVTDKTLFANWIQQQLPAVQITAVMHTGNTLEISGLNPQKLKQLQACPWVNFIDVPNRKPKEERAIDYLDLAANKITPVHTSIPWLAGSGLAVSVKEKPFDTNDIDFKGRIVNIDTTAELPTVHATTIATMIAGGGNSASSGKGVAWQSRLATSSFSELMPDNGQQLTEKGISVQNHSYGVGIENYYGLEALAYDKHCMEYPHLLHVFSSGNAGEEASTTGAYSGMANYANLTGQFKMSKNTLSVGAADRFGQVAVKSSRGPAYDGRIKPEVTALGEGGTSEAAALVSGISLLVQQAFQKENNGLLPPASLVKAAIINSADEAGQKGIDFLTGFGHADGLGAVHTILDKQFFTSSLSHGNTQTFTIAVPKERQQLKVTLVWHDVEAAPDAQQALVNDLDLELIQTATGKSWQPWVLNHAPHPDSLLLPASRKADHLNNVEQITLPFPEPGNYTLQVNGYAVTSGLQAFSLAYEFESGDSWIHPAAGSNLQAGMPAVLRWQWHKPSVSGSIEFKSPESKEWQLIGTVDDLAQSYFEWIPPDSLTQGQLRLVAGNVMLVSGTFSLTKPIPLQVGYNCEGEAMLYWSKMQGVSQYQVFRLGETYLEPFIITADTAILLNSTQMQVPHYAVAPITEGFTGEKSVTIDLTSQDIGCYITSFLPRQLVTDTAFFDLSISTAFGLESISLERWEKGSFKTIQTISPVNSLTMELKDQFPSPGRNEYRIKLQNNKQQFFYSQTEPVYYMHKNDLLVFPNPLAKGQPIHIIEGGDQTIVIRLYDNLGRLLYESEESGTIKTIPSGLLKKGTYLIQVHTESGTVLSKRIVVF